MKIKEGKNHESWQNSENITKASKLWDFATFKTKWLDIIVINAVEIKEGKNHLKWQKYQNDNAQSHENAPWDFAAFLKIKRNIAVVKKGKNHQKWKKPIMMKRKVTKIRSEFCYLFECYSHEKVLFLVPF